MKKVASKTLSPGGRRLAIAVASLIVIAAASWGGLIAFRKLRAAWVAQCVVTDVLRETKVYATPHVSEESVREWFGLTNGCNLALIDFDDLRETILRERPIVKDIALTRHLPNGVDIAISEREPVARVNLKKKRIQSRGKTTFTTIWNVADSEGIVFLYDRKDSARLPLITGETAATPIGKTLSGKARVALRLAEIAANPAYRPLSVDQSEISISNETYLYLRTGDHKTLRISWRLIELQDDANMPNLERILMNARDVMASGLYPGPRILTASNIDQIAVSRDPVQIEDAIP